MRPDLATVKPRLRGVSHQWAALLLGPALFVVALAIAPERLRVPMLIYAVGVTTMLTVSACYHRLPLTPSQKRLAARFDYSAIYLCIAGTYTPVAVVALPEGSARLVLTTVWLGALVGIVLQWLPRRPPTWLWGPLYIVVGWTAILAGGDLVRGLGAAGFTLVLAGGLAFTAGAIVFLAKRPDPWPRTFGYHEVFHLFVLAGVGLHFTAVVTAVLPRA